jgi:polysaccharide export outer membrane protein
MKDLRIFPGFGRHVLVRPGAGFQASGIALALLALLCCRPGQAAAKPPEENRTVEAVGRFRKEYVYSPGDQIEVFVRRVPEVSRTVVIRPDGFISLPLIGGLQAAGLTTSELEAKLVDLLGKRLVNPEVNVIAVQTRQPSVYVLGEVNNPSAVPLRNTVTAMQAIAYAGGFRRSAAERKVVVIRLGADGHLRAVPAIPDSKGQAGPYLALGALVVEADDIVFVPESGRSQFTRFLDDFVNHPLQGIDSIAATYINFKLVEIFSRQ